jgi:hypothetical protein
MRFVIAAMLLAVCGVFAWGVGSIGVSHAIEDLCAKDAGADSAWTQSAQLVPPRIDCRVSNPNGEQRASSHEVWAWIRSIVVLGFPIAWPAAMATVLYRFRQRLR